MTDPNQIGRLRRTGVITQVTAVDLSGDGTPQALNPTEFTQAQFLERMRVLLAQVNPESLADLEDQIFHHLQDRDNPHQDKLIDLVTDVGGEMFADYVPGTVPLAPPVFAFDPRFVDYLPVSVVRASAVNVIGRNGMYVSVPANTPAVSWIDGYPSLLLWPERVQYLASPNPRTSSEIAGIRANIGTGDIPGIPSPDGSTDRYVTINETAATGEHGARITSIFTAGNEYCLSAHFHHQKSAGFLVFRFTQIPNELSFFDIQAGKFTSVSAQHVGHAQRMNCGFDRIGISAVATQSGTGSLEVLYSPTATIGGMSYAGSSGLSLFQVFGMNVTGGAGLAPYIESNSILAESTATLTVTPIPNGRGTLAVTYTAAQSLLSQTQNIASFGSGLSMNYLGSDHRSIVRNRIPAVTQTSPLLNGERARAAVSYSPDRTITLHSGVGRSVTNGTFNDIGNFDTLILGSFPGGISGIVGYPAEDTGQVCEFLVREKML